jgi:hypothetical protein
MKRDDLGVYHAKRDFAGAARRATQKKGRSALTSFNATMRRASTSTPAILAKRKKDPWARYFEVKQGLPKDLGSKRRDR